MDFELARFNMVEQQVRPWNVFDERVLALLGQVKRENFVAEQYRPLALSDIEIPLPGQQNMLFPRIEARLLQELKLNKKDKVLEIGTGSGYVTALLAKLADFVYSLEINSENKQFAIDNLTAVGAKNISVIEADGSAGFASKAPFDKIFVGGSLKQISAQLTGQLKIGGRLVAVVGSSPIMHAILIERLADKDYKQTTLFETWLAELVSPSQDNFKF